MQFRTKIPIEKEENLIDYDSNIILLGSCFSENISEKLHYSKLHYLRNPLGILFHPKAIENSLNRAIHKLPFTSDSIFYHNERWHSFEAHSSLSNVSKKDLLENLNKNSVVLNQQISKASHIIITLGTAWVYRLLETEKLVANCHKIPQKKFKKDLLTVVEVTESLQTIISLIRSVNKDIQLIFTLSPVRHSKDGFVENAQSKAHLLSAIHEVVKDTNISYFPAYEIVMDELRDYRFYAEDMIHPNQIAIAYIWERFCDAWLSEVALKTMKSVHSIQKGLAHRPFHPKSTQHQKFMENISSQIKNLQKQFPRVFFEK